MQALFDGFSRLKQKEADAMKRPSGIHGPGVKEATVHDLRNVPGVQMVRRKRK